MINKNLKLKSWLDKYWHKTNYNEVQNVSDFFLSNFGQGKLVPKLIHTKW